MSLFWGASTSKFDEDVERATAETLPSGGENIELNFEISDSIRSKTVQAKDAMRTIKRRVNHKNPNVQLLALTLTDTCIKNGGDHFLVEIASREFLDNLVSIIKVPTVNLEVKNKILRLVQNWAMAFESKPTLSYAGEVYKQLQKEGFNFPPKDIVAMSAAMIDSMTPPEWIDSDVCLRCRTPFSFTNRKHHCRSCGLVFDQQCSSKVLPLPHLGIDQPVRVCDGCFVKVGGKSKTAHGDAKKAAPESHHRRTLSKSTPSHQRQKSARELADEELQRAIQLSLEDAGMVHGPRRTDYVPEQTPVFEVSEPPLVDSSAYAADGEEEDPDLRAAIEASLREASAPKPSAPVVEEQEDEYIRPQYAQPQDTVASHIQPLPNFDLDDQESDAIMTFSQAVETAQSRGATDFVRHREVGDLYERTNSMQPKLARSLDDAGRREQILAEMNQKLSQAARLYDQLLTAQVSSPARLPASPPPVQQYAPYYTPPPVQTQAPPQHYGQYAPSSPPMSQPPQTEQYDAYTPLASAAYDHVSHAPTQASRHETPYESAGPSTVSQQPVSIQPQYYQPPAPQQPATSFSTPSQPPQQVFSPPPPPQTVASPPPAIASTPQPHPQHSHTLPPQQQYQQLYQPQHQQTLPAFPSVPTAPLPAAVVSSPPLEQKEAMLISFD